MLKAMLRLAAVLVLVVAAVAGWCYGFIFERDLDQGAPTPVATATAASGLATAVDTSRRLCADLRREASYPSLSVALMIDGTLDWREAIGWADLGTRAPAHPDTQYPIGSISKPLTSTAAMRMVEAGSLSLDAGIETYLPDLPAHYHGVTLRQLLSHQAGVRHYGRAFNPPFFSESGVNTEYPTVASGLTMFIDDPLLFAPDMSFRYSTFGYSLASRVMEAASGKDFLTLMDDMLFKPLAMNSTEADRAAPAPALRSRDYLVPLKGWGVVDTPPTNSSWKWAGGGFVSTPEDLAHFGAALIAGRALTAERFAEATTPRLLASGQPNPQHYGLGWRSGTMSYPRGSQTTVPILHHGGTALGAECMLLLAPEQQLSAAVCGNAYTGGSDSLLQLAADIAREFLDARTTAATPIARLRAP